MLEQYYIYDTEKLLKNLNNARRTLRNLERQYADLDGARAMDYSNEKVCSSPSKDRMELIAIRRANLKLKIDRYKRDIELVDKCINALPNDEQIALNEFFVKNPESKQSAVVKLCDKLALEQSAVYSLRRKALRDFERLLFG